MVVFCTKTAQIYGDFARCKLDKNQSFGYLNNTSRSWKQTATLQTWPCTRGTGICKTSVIQSPPHHAPTPPLWRVQGSSEVISIPQTDLALVLACHKFNSLLSELVTTFFCTAGFLHVYLECDDIEADIYFVRKSVFLLVHLTFAFASSGPKASLPFPHTSLLLEWRSLHAL